MAQVPSLLPDDATGLPDDATGLPDNVTGLPDNVTGHLHIPAREEAFGSWDDSLSPRLLEVLKHHGITQPWSHQAQAIAQLAAGHHIVVATGTGSGKSLCAWVPVLNALCTDAAQKSGRLASYTRRPTTIYLSPTKALGADQRLQVDTLAHELDPHIAVSSADGDCDGPTRRFAREHADIILTNPDFLHFSMLSRAENWARIWRGLRFIVVDEFHHYRGNFGAHVALVLRRTLRIAAHYGAHPQVIFLSATSGNPAAVAQRFLGTAFGDIHAISNDGSPAGARDIYTLNGSESASRQAAHLTADVVKAGARVLTFLRSRAGTERVAELTRAELDSSSPELSSRVAAYRGGFLPEERRELESRIRSGDLQALCTTSALELGIDISGLDATIIVGWPGTHASFHQQSGRAGRAGNTGLTYFIARDNPLDQYLASHPQTLRTCDSAEPTFDPSNPWILPDHLAAAAYELPLTTADLAVFSLQNTRILDDMVTAGLLKKRPSGWFWNTDTRITPHDLVELRGAGIDVAIVDTKDGNVLGTVDHSRADSTVFPGAIYLHQGQPYRITELGSDIALAEPAPDSDIRTFARSETTVSIVETLHSLPLPHGSWNYGIVNVRSQVTGYDVRRLSDGVFLGTVHQEMPVREFVTAGSWLTLATATLNDCGIDSSEIPGALHAGEHTMIGMLPLLATCDRWDIGGLSTAYHRDTGQPTIIIHDAISGGSGAALRGFHAANSWLQTTLDTLDSCPCDTGCPSCVQSPKCGNNNSPLSKSGAQLLMALAVREFHGAGQPEPVPPPPAATTAQAHAHEA